MPRLKRWTAASQGKDPWHGAKAGTMTVPHTSQKSVQHVKGSMGDSWHDARPGARLVKHLSSVLSTLHRDDLIAWYNIQALFAPLVSQWSVDQRIQTPWNYLQLSCHLHLNMMTSQCKSVGKSVVPHTCQYLRPLLCPPKCSLELVGAMFEDSPRGFGWHLCSLWDCHLHMRPLNRLGGPRGNYKAFAAKWRDRIPSRGRHHCLWPIYLRIVIASLRMMNMVTSIAMKTTTTTTRCRRTAQQHNQILLLLLLLPPLLVLLRAHEETVGEWWACHSLRVHVKVLPSVF